jgi:hypothetical protein
VLVLVVEVEVVVVVEVVLEVVLEHCLPQGAICLPNTPSLGEHCQWEHQHGHWRSQQHCHQQPCIL